jgi:hypothetical protein
MNAPGRILGAGPAFRRGAPSTGSEPLKARRLPQPSCWDCLRVSNEVAEKSERRYGIARLPEVTANLCSRTGRKSLSRFHRTCTRGNSGKANQIQTEVIAVAVAPPVHYRARCKRCCGSSPHGSGLSSSSPSCHYASSTPSTKPTAVRSQDCRFFSEFNGRTICQRKMSCLAAQGCRELEDPT